MPVVIVGVDVHKRTRTLVAVDETGRKLAEKTVAATPDGDLEAVAWAGRWPERRWALEDCRHLTRRLELDLLRAGEAAVRVPPHLTTVVRQGSRERGKSDPIDALAVAPRSARSCAPWPPLLALPGCGLLSAAKLVGETAGAGRFRSRAAFARWNGTAPIPVWASNSTRHRLSRGGNRQVNTALHRIELLLQIARLRRAA